MPSSNLIYYTVFETNKIKSVYTELHISFQPENIRLICQAVPKLIYDLGLVDAVLHRESIRFDANPSKFSKFATRKQILNGKMKFGDEKLEGFSEI